jgi:hypothetical protein
MIFSGNTAFPEPAILQEENSYAIIINYLKMLSIANNIVTTLGKFEET